MLTEDGLLFLAVLAACGLVVLGALELVWPTRPRHRERWRAGRLTEPGGADRPR
jgi:hypothetical protein